MNSTTCFKHIKKTSQQDNIVSCDETCSTVNVALENTATINTIPSTKYIYLYNLKYIYTHIHTYTYIL